MVLNIIQAYPINKRIARSDDSRILNISECFADTVQGENIVGVPSTFLRMQYCSLNCQWCDTTEVWRKGNPYSVNEFIDILYGTGVINKLKKGQHLILTGGSPLLQQDGLVELIEKIKNKYHFKPFIEIENECTIMPNIGMIKYVNVWNNSPKLANSGMKKSLQYKPDVLQFLGNLPNSYFKFVIQNKDEWKQIEEDFINKGYIKKEQIVLMPEGQTRDELQKHYQEVIDLATEYNVRMTDRLHITIYNKKVSV
jgi:7-carboxy-7-deazaguanine synthase